MVLEEVKEMWTTETKMGYDKRTPKPVHKDRFLGMMFLRGDSVILVVKIGRQTSKWDTRYHDSDNKKPVTLPTLVESYEEVGGGMTAEPKGYGVKYVVMGFEYDHANNRDQRHHDQSDGLDEQYEKIHLIPTVPMTRQEWGIIPDTEQSTKHEMTGHLEIYTKGVVPLMTPEHRMPMVVEKINMKDGEMPQALGGVTSHLEHDTPQYQLLTNGEEG